MIAKLRGLHPRLVTSYYKISHACAELGFPIVITSGVRTEAEQAALYSQGRTKPGRIVTYADGVRKKSNHQPKDDGYGYAFDVAFVVNGQPSWDESHPWQLYGEMVKALGLIWGGDWETLRDRPHAELPEELAEQSIVDVGPDIIGGGAV